MDFRTAKTVVISAAGIILAGALAAAGAYGGRVAKTPPPWVSLADEQRDVATAKVEAATAVKQLDTKMTRGQLYAAHDRCVSAMRAPDKQDLIVLYIKEFADLMDEYETLTGRRLELHCER